MAKNKRPIWEIDEDNLDKEVIRQPALVGKYCDQVPDAKQEVDRAAAQMKLIEADLDAEIRADPEKFGLEKVTEAAIKSTIPGCKKFKDAQSAYLDAKHHLDALNSVLQALDSKRRSLDLLITLHGMNYFSSPRKKSPKGLRGEDD